MNSLACNPTHAAFRKPLATSVRIAGGVLVTVIHALLISVLARHQNEPRRILVNAEPMIAEIHAAEPSEFLTAGIQFVTVDRPIELSMPTLPVSSNPDLTIDAPRIDPGLTVDIANFTARAELPAGSTATVLLTLEITAHGSVASARVVRSNAGDAANAAAVAYAHETRWTPGMVGGEPRAMQASLTVILGERS